MNDSDLGPLPKSHRNEDIEDLSVRALLQRIPASMFNLRWEVIKDKGVDASLELKVDGHHTNIRAQLQLKGTETAQNNADGSVSFSVEVSNLNYILNGPSPLYILYIQDRDEIRFVWARDERRRLDTANPGWMQQKTITLRFEHVLAPSQIDDIFERILAEARLIRKIDEMMARALPGEQVLTSIDPVTRTATDPKERYALVEANGIAMVSAGYGAEVLVALELLNQDAKHHPRILLIHAYAEYSLGKYLAATGHIAEALGQQDALSSEDRMFADFLNDACDFHSGRISMADYLAQKEVWSQQATGVIALSQRLEILRHAIVDQEDPTVRVNTLVEIQSIVNELGKAPEVDAASKLQARIVLLYAEGQQYLNDFLDAVFQAQMRGTLPQAQTLDEFVTMQRDLQQSWQHWEAESNCILREAFTGGYPLLIADASVFTANILSIYLVDCRIVSIGTGTLLEPPTAMIEAGKELAEQAQHIYQKAGSLEGELRAKMVLANLLEFDNQPEAAQGLAQVVLPLAKAMRYLGLERQARDHLEGKSLLTRAVLGAQESAEQDRDIRWASMPEAVIPAMARQLMLARQLPESQKPVIEDQLRRLRAIAIARFTWCRYIALTDPDGRCRCMKHGFKVNNSIKDWNAQFAGFKEAYCDSCPSRSPRKPLQ